MLIRSSRALPACRAALGLGAVWAVADRITNNFSVALDHPATRYYQEPADPVARLEKRQENGQAKLDFALNQQDLTTLLRQLEINIEFLISAHGPSRSRRAAYRQLI